MNSPSVLRRFRRNLHDYGLVITLGKTLRSAAKRVYDARTYRIYRIDLHEATVVPPSNDTLTFRFVEAGEQSVIRQIERMEDWLHNRLDGRLCAGGLCLAALDGARVVGFNLVAFGSIEVPVIRGAWYFRPGTAWSEQITVRPAWRSKGVAAELRYRMFEALRRCGVRRFYGGTLATNRASRRLARKVGFREIIDVRYCNILGMPTWSYMRVRRATSVAVSDRPCGEGSDPSTSMRRWTLKELSAPISS